MVRGTTPLCYRGLSIAFERVGPEFCRVSTPVYYSSMVLIAADTPEKAIEEMRRVKLTVRNINPGRVAK